MAWWVWLLLAWMLLAVVLGVGLGLALRTADRLDRSYDPPSEDVPDEGRDAV